MVKRIEVPNCFRDTPLLEHLKSRQISRLVFAGMLTHMQFCDLKIDGSRGWPIDALARRPRSAGSDVVIPSG